MQGGADVEENIKIIASISAALTGAIIGWMAVLRPLLEALKARRAQRQKAIEEALKVDKEYRQEVLNRLESLGTHINPWTAALLNCSAITSSARTACSKWSTAIVPAA